jgi:leucine-rich repeat protein SHOC2
MASNDDSENDQLSSQSSDNLSETAQIEVCPGQKKNEVKLIVNKRKRQQTQTVSSEELLELLSKITATQQCLLKIQNLQTPALGRLINCIAFDQLVELDLSCFELLEELRTDLEFGPMINLKHLNLDNTNLRRLHPSIGRLENLSRLSLSHNSLYDLPVTVRLLRKLLYINITENLFRGLPSALYHLTNLKEIVGLNHNLLEMSDKWSSNNLFITCTSPLASARVEHENVPSLQSMCVLQSVGMNVWKISMPEKHKLTILERAILYDLCEVCMAPVKKITPHQETDG